MPLNITLPTGHVDGDSGHSDAHNATNSAVNQVAAEIDAHEADTTGVHGIADTTALATTATTNALGARITALEASSGAGVSNMPLSILRGALASRDAGPRVIVCCGDSVTAGLDASTPQDRYVNRLSAALQARYPLASGSSPAVVAIASAVGTATGVQLVNAGISGTTSASYIPASGVGSVASIAALNPRAVLHTIGLNDYSAQTSIATFKANITANIAALKAAITVPCLHVLVHLHHNQNITGRTITWADYGTAMAEIAAANTDSNVIYLDLSGVFQLNGIPATDPNDLINDGLHPGNPGHALIADLLYDQLLAPIRLLPLALAGDGTGGTLTNTVAPVVAPAITGSAITGQTLTISNGTWNVTPDSYTYVWKRAGVAISGAGSATYVLQVADEGQAITCTVTASKTTYTSGSATSNSVTPTSGSGGTLTNTVAPSISGTASMAQTLTAGNGTWSAVPDSYTRQWKRAGADIPGATGSTYVVAAADVGQAITVTVTASKATYVPGSATSSSVTPTAGTFTNATIPTITGTAQDGQTLTAGSGTWSQAPDSYTYAWKRAGSAISGATSSTYLLVTADVGNTITVTVTAVKAGYTSVSATSAATGSVAAGGGVSPTVADSFNRADSSSLGSTPTGAKAWVVGGIGNWAIASNQLSATAVNGGFGGWLNADCGSGDGTVTITCIAIANAGLHVRSTTGRDGLVFVAAGANYKLYSGWDLVLLGTSSGITPTNGDVLSVVMSGSSIICKVNGTTAISVTNSTGSANTRHGPAVLGATTGLSAMFDDFSFTP